ncbi:MAG: Ig-like domain-containing protein [Kofleriaceae bacterium]
MMFRGSSGSSPLSLLAWFAALAALLFACGGDSQPDAPDLSIDPGRLTLAAGRVGRAAATIDGAAARPGQVTWSAAPVSIATIEESASGEVQITARAPGQAKILASFDGQQAELDVTVLAAEVDALEVSPAAPTLPAGTALELVATATLSDGSTEVVTGDVTWQSSDLGTATIDAMGRLRAVRKGAVTVTATLAQLQGSAAVTVGDAVLAAIAVNPTTPSVPKGLTQQLSAQGTYSDGSTQDLTAAVTWASSDAARVSVSNTAGSAGLATALTLGSAMVTATLDGVQGGTLVDVVAPIVSSIAVTPSAPSVTVGGSVQLTSIATLSDGSAQDVTPLATWTSSVTAVATVSSAAGTRGLVTAVAAGSSIVTASLGGVAGSATVTVNAATLTALAVTPATASIAVGGTAQYTAMGTYSDGATRDVTGTATWASSAAAVATISNAMGTRGLATGVAGGSTTISASLDGRVASATLMVTAVTLTALAVTPATASIAVGGTAQYTATGTYSDGSTRDVTGTATWASSAAAVATISNGAGTRGLATGVAGGSTTISASLDGRVASATLTVTAPTLTTLAVTPATASIAVGGTVQYTAMGTYSDGATRDVTATATWASSAPAVATISNGAGTRGLATGVAGGSTTISASLDGRVASATLTVTASAPTRIRLMAGNLTSGNLQGYEPGHGGRIFDGLNPDVVMIQEFNYFPGNSTADLRAWVTSVFGANYSFYREVGAQIPNGVISRFPILAAGTWEDTISPNREFVWARLDIPGNKDLWAVSVHLLTRDAPTRNNQAVALRELINANVPASDYLVIGGDFNTDSRGEACISTLSSLVSTSAPYPVDQAGVGGTNASRSKPYDWVLMDSELRALQTPVTIGNASFPAGLVFDSRVYTPLSDVAPVQFGDSGATNMQHMGVVIDVLVP